MVAYPIFSGTGAVFGAIDSHMNNKATKEIGAYHVRDSFHRGKSLNGKYQPFSHPFPESKLQRILKPMRYGTSGGVLGALSAGPVGAVAGTSSGVLAGLADAQNQKNKTNKVEKLSREAFQKGRSIRKTKLTRAGAVGVGSIIGAGVLSKMDDRKALAKKANAESFISDAKRKGWSLHHQDPGQYVTRFKLNKPREFIGLGGSAVGATGGAFSELGTLKGMALGGGVGGVLLGTDSIGRKTRRIKDLKIQREAEHAFRASRGKRNTALTLGASVLGGAALKKLHDHKSKKASDILAYRKNSI